MAKAIKDEIKRLGDAKNDKKVAAYIDKVQYGIQGYRGRYYAEKFHAKTEQEQTDLAGRIRQSYCEGLAWVYSYYYKGVQSWDWFYPFHYAPFALDLVNCDRVDIDFKIGEPARPFEQLMAVFPKQSAHAIPQCYRHLLSDPKSEIIDFYPTEFKLDVNGAAFAWMGVNLLPFIDRPRLLRAMAKADERYTKLTEGERARNKVTGEIIIFYKRDEASKSALARCPVESLKQPFDCSFNARDPVFGQCEKSTESLALGAKVKLITETEPGETLFAEQMNSIGSLSFFHPIYKEHNTHLLDQALLPKREVEDFEIYDVDRRYFQGESMIRLVGRVLGIDVNIDKRYRYGYKNCHAAQEPAPERKRREREYDPTDLGQANSGQGYKRPRMNDSTAGTASYSG